MYETIDEYLRTSFYNNPTIEDLLKQYENMVNNNEMTSFAAAHKLLDTYNKMRSGE
jgi:LAO/AO transport system kinase